MKHIIIEGGYNCYWDNDCWYQYDIQEYDPEEDTITTVGRMQEARAWHAISVVNTEQYDMWCT